MFDLATICAAIASALEHEAHRLDIEQSPYGLDALDELALHPIVRAACAELGHGVHPEERYPAVRSTRRRSEGDRCDLVLTERAGERLLDPLATGTLFRARGVAVDEALWLEVKLARQFSILDSGAGPDHGYASRLLGAATTDLRKLAGSADILLGAVVLILLCRDDETARHDVSAWAHSCLDKGVLIDTPFIELFKLTDRIGNAVCAVAVTRVRPG